MKQQLRYPPKRQGRTTWLRAIPVPAPRQTKIFKDDEWQWIQAEVARLLDNPSLWIDALMELVDARQGLFEVPITRSGITGVVGFKVRVEGLARWFALDYFASRLVAEGMARQAGYLLRQRPFESAILRENSYLGAVIAGMLAASEPPPKASVAINESKDCPYCAESIRLAAIICRFCNREQPPDYHAT